MSDRAVVVLPRVTDVEAEVIDNDVVDYDVEGNEITRWWAYVWPCSNGQPLAELQITEAADLEAWIDSTGYEWPDEARAQLRSQLPKENRTHRRPEIEDRPPLDELRDKAIKVLTEANHPPVFFRRGGLVTEIRRNERRVPSAQRVEATRMRDRLGEVADWFGVGKGGSYPVKPPMDIASTVLVTPGLHLPPLDAIVEHPVIGKDGRLRTRRGYDRESATYFSPTVPLSGVHIDGHPRVAFSWLSELLEDFEFASQADRTNVIALMLTPVLRPIIDGPVPLCAIRAAKAGNGKSLLAKAVFTVLNGYVPPTTSLTERDEDEADKRLTSILLDGEPIVFLDNVQTGTVLKSAALARALTTPAWKGRIIRSSESPTVPVRCTWVATGNNLTMNDEIARRSYMIELTSTMERPDLRDPGEFRHEDLLGWVKDNRSSLLSAVLSLVGDWIEEGRPITPGPSLSSFEDWSRIVGSVLRNAGARHFLGNEERKREIGEDDTATHREILLRTIRAIVRDREFTLKELHQETTVSQEMIDATAPFLPDKVYWGDDKAVVHLGNSLRPVVDGIYGGLQLRRRGKGMYGQKFVIRAAS
jgi:hypothetical protein